jgi:hypothetical protein
LNTVPENRTLCAPTHQDETAGQDDQGSVPPTTDARTTRAPNANSRLEQGATNQETKLTYGVRFFSARPVRQAFIRMIQLQQKNLEADVIERMNSFAELPSNDALINRRDERRIGQTFARESQSARGFRFYSELGTAIKLNMRFRIADMMVDGKLEY